MTRLALNFCGNRIFLGLAVFTGIFCPPLSEARNYLCTDRYSVNMNFGSFVLRADEKVVEVTKLELSASRLAEISRNDIRSLREKNILSPISERDRQYAVKFAFDFSGEAAPYGSQHPLLNIRRLYVSAQPRFLRKPLSRLATAS